MEDQRKYRFAQPGYYRAEFFQNEAGKALNSMPAFLVPAEADKDTGATDNQIDGVRSFYHLEIPNLSDEQAHILLSVRNYAHEFGKEFTGGYGWARNMVSRLIAAHVLETPHLVKHAVKRSERRYSRNEDGPQNPSRWSTYVEVGRWWGDEEKRLVTALDVELGSLLNMLVMPIQPFEPSEASVVVTAEPSTDPA